MLHQVPLLDLNSNTKSKYTINVLAFFLCGELMADYSYSDYMARVDERNYNMRNVWTSDQFILNIKNAEHEWHGTKLICAGAHDLAWSDSLTIYLETSRPFTVRFRCGPLIFLLKGNVLHKLSHFVIDVPIQDLYDDCAIFGLNTLYSTELVDLMLRFKKLFSTLEQIHIELRDTLALDYTQLNPELMQIKDLKCLQ